MRSPLSGLLRRLGEERPDELAQLGASAVGARRPSLPALADGHGHRHFLLALVAKELVERHGHSSSRPRRSPCLAQVHDDRFHPVYSSIPSWPPSRPRPDSLNPPNGISWV